MQVERIDFLAVPVDDLGAAESWYGDTLGLPRNPSTSGEKWVEFETGNLTVALSQFGGAVAFGVPDVAAARQELEAKGIAFEAEPFDSGVCHGQPFADPFGNRLLLHHRYAPIDEYEVSADWLERTDFVAVPVTDRERAIEFYGETLGLPRNERAHPEWPEFEPGPTLVLTTPEQTGVQFRPSAYSLALRVGDVAAQMGRLGVDGDPYDSGVCHMGFLADPDGNSLILHRRYAPYSDGSTP